MVYSYNCNGVCSNTPCGPPPSTGVIIGGAAGAILLLAGAAYLYKQRSAVRAQTQDLKAREAAFQTQLPTNLPGAVSSAQVEVTTVMPHASIPTAPQHVEMVMQPAMVQPVEVGMARFDPHTGKEIPFSEVEAAQYSELFRAMAGGGTRVPKDKVWETMQRANLPANEAEQIWRLCDVDCDGFVDEEEVQIILHLAAARFKGQPIPDVLPRRWLTSPLTEQA